MKQDLGPLGQVDLLTDPELKQSLGHGISHAIREWYRGLDYMGFAGPGNGTNTLTIPGPDSGYTWSVKLASVSLSTSGVLSVYAADNPGGAPLGIVASIANGTANEAVFRWGSNQCVIKDQRNITLFSSGSVILAYRLLVEQAPTEMQGKL
jgi:hypothetical protein